MKDTLKKLLGIPARQDLDSFLRGLQTPDCLVKNLLENPNVDPSAERDLIRYSTEKSREDFKEQVAGAIGFFLFAHSADQGDPKEQRGTLNVYLSASDIKAFIRREYRLPRETHGAQLELHRVGSSSYVFRADAWAVKLIKPRYWPNKTISLATDDYETEHQGVDRYSPKVHFSGERYIVMDFIEGSDLRDYSEAHPPDFILDAAKALRHIARISDGLCDALAAHAGLEHPRYHLDLSPPNIMIRESGVPYVALIDFGVNYLLTQCVGSAPARRQTQIYVARELDDDPNAGTIASDIYSFGMILLELLTAAKDSRRDASLRLDFRDVSLRLDSLWARWPRLAVLIESMIDDKSCDRLFDYPRDASLYRVIKAQVADECELAARLEEVRKTKLPLLATTTAAARRLKRLWVLFATARTLKSQNRSPGAREARGLFRWAVASQVAEVVIVVFFLLYTIIDAKILWWPDLQRLLQSVRVPVPKGGDWHHNLPGRLVGLSFGLLGARYYINIFSTISTKSLSTLTNWTSRLTAMSFAPPILWAMIRPPHWPFCSAFGCAIVALNNELSYRLAERAKQESGATFDLPESAVQDAFLTEFSSWGRSMAWYAVALAAIGVLLRLGWAHDEWIYAGVAAIVVNLINMYHVICHSKAPLVSAGLARLVGRLRRARAKENAKRDPVWDVAADR